MANRRGMTVLKCSGAEGAYQSEVLLEDLAEVNRLRAAIVEKDGPANDQFENDLRLLFRGRGMEPDSKILVLFKVMCPHCDCGTPAELHWQEPGGEPLAVRVTLDLPNPA